jgi:uncharacterized protein YciI
VRNALFCSNYPFGIKHKQYGMFIVSLSYKKDLHEVEKLLDRHVAFLDKYYAQKKFIFSGRKKPRTGGVILVQTMDKEALMEIIREDPFYSNAIADYDITEVIPTKYDEQFAYFIE